MSQSSEQSFYDAIGGHETIKLIVDTFYAGVAEDEELRPMYPEEDLGPAAHRFTMFLEQYWGGPTTYSELSGHPRLRMRHSPYEIDSRARDLWLKHFRSGLDAAKLAPEHDEQFWGYVQHAANFMINTPG